MEIKMHLNNEPFKLVKEGSKNIEIRLYDEKRRQLNVGDIIEFTNRDTGETLKVELTNIYTYENFEELYKHHDKISLGYKEEDIASPADMNIYYSMQEQIKYGVVALEFKLL